MSYQIDGDFRFVGSEVEYAPQDGSAKWRETYTGGNIIFRNLTDLVNVFQLNTFFPTVRPVTQFAVQNPFNGNQVVLFKPSLQLVEYQPNFGVDKWQEIYAAGLWKLRNETQGFNAYICDANGMMQLPIVGGLAIIPSTPAQITVNTNDFAINGQGVSRISSDAARNITGIVAGISGEKLSVVNVGSFAITLKEENVGSAAANRILTGNGDIPLDPNEGVLLSYDTTSSRWRPENRMAETVAHALGGGSHTADTLANLNLKVSDATLIDTGDSRLSDARTPTAHTHAASDVNSGTFADARIAESNVTQHEAAIDHDALTNFVLDQHRIINDAGSTTIELLSASKILSLLAAVTSGIDVKDPVETVADTNITLSGEQTINGVTTSVSRIAVIGQTDATENGFYLSAAGAWSRTTDADEDSEVTNGMATIVLNSSSTFFRHRIILSTADPITLGVTALSFVDVPAVDFGTTAGTSTEGNDSRVLTQDENDAAQGTDGIPSISNRFLTNSDSRNSDARTPTSHASTHTNGTDDIQDATAVQKGLATATQITKLDGIEALAEVNVVDSVFTRAGAVVAAASDYDASQVDNDSGVTGIFVSDALDTLDAIEAHAESLPITWERAANNPATTLITNEWAGFEFQNATTRAVITNFKLPTQMDLTGSPLFPIVTITLYVSQVGAQNDDVHLELEVMNVTPATADLISGAESETKVADPLITNTLNRTRTVSFILTPGLMSTSDHVRLRLRRIGADVDDTFTGRVSVLKESRFSFGRVF